MEVSFKRVKDIGVLALAGTIDINSSALIEKVAWALDNGYRDLL